MQTNSFLFSVIVPVYNTEVYLEETIQSVINQSIGFDNIQLILVNNATEDNSEAICLRYKEQYPRNIEYVKLEKNAGPSGARNAGIPYIQGQYVNFLDSDDKWSENAFALAYDFFEEHPTDLAFVSCRMRTFDATDSWMHDDYRFSQSMICDIFQHPDYLQFWISPTFFKSSSFPEAQFDETALFSEDMKFINQQLIPNGKYGILREAVFYYRKRDAGNNSQVQQQRNHRYWYFDSPKQCFLPFVDLSKKLYGQVIPYVQYLLMQEITWRACREELPVDFDESDQEQYIQIIQEMLQYVDDYIICSFKYSWYWKEHKLFCLSLKYGEDYVREHLIPLKARFTFHNMTLFNKWDPNIFIVYEHHLEGHHLVLDGKINLPLHPSDYSLYIKDAEGETYPLAYYPGDNSNIKKSMGLVCLERRCFRVAVPLSKEFTEIAAYLRVQNIDLKVKIKFNKNARLTHSVDHSYVVENGFILTNRRDQIQAQPYEDSLHQSFEDALIKELKQKKLRKSILLRKYAQRVLKNKKAKWLITDRPAIAQDNGEYFFRYASSVEGKEVDVIFAVSKKSPDYKRLKKYGKVIPFGGIQYKLAYLTASHVIFSAWGYGLDNPLGWHNEYVKDLIFHKRIYLDHALTKDNISHDLNKHYNNLQLWTTGAKAEQESIQNWPYGYDPSVPALTGLARYDAIFPHIGTQPKKTILLAPTWRKGLVNEFDTKTGFAKYNTAFKTTEFYLFYNALMNDPKVVACMNKKGYKGVLSLHPLMSAQNEDFQTTDTFSLLEKSHSLFDQQFKDNALVVTDYSSIAMDYAYAGRSVLYAQFDLEEFYKTHSYQESYFDYERDGFGPVCYDYDTTIDQLIQIIEQDCALSPVYEQRRQQFFAFLDDKNCKRIYSAIQQL